LDQHEWRTSSIRVAKEALEMNEILPQSNRTCERASNTEETATFECPRCASAITRDDHYCAKCGAKLIVCHGCKSPNVGHAQSCHRCGQPIVRSPAPNEITIASKTRDFDILDEAALAIVKLREIIESIERLELAHQIACSQSVSVQGKHCCKGRFR